MLLLEENEKVFKFEQTLETSKIDTNGVKILLDRYNIKEDISEGELSIEEFSNNKDCQLDYDVSLKVNNKNYTIKTSNKLSSIKETYNDILKSIIQ